MADTKNKQSGGIISSAFGVAKKLSSTGIQLLNQVAPDSVTRITQPLVGHQVVEGSARKMGAFEARKYEDPKQMLKDHLPQVSRQVLGRHYGKVNQVAHFVSPQLSDRISDYFFEQLNTFSSDISSVDALLDEAGIRDLEELTQDVDRSRRISQAFAEQNKWIASVQGALTGATGAVGSAVDIPASIILALRTIYQVGRSYGFELNKETEQDIVQFIFRQVDLGLIAEKQAMLLGLKAVSNVLKTHDVQQLQLLLGSGNDLEALKKWLTTDEGELKWAWLNNIPKVSVLGKLTPLISASVSAVYSWKLVEDVNTKAQQVFSGARAYLIDHKDTGLSPVAAYEKSLELISQAAPKLIGQIEKVKQEKSLQQAETDVTPDSESSAVTQKKTETTAKDTVAEPKRSVRKPAVTKNTAASAKEKSASATVEPVKKSTAGTAKTTRRRTAAKTVKDTDTES